jgi:hypothetical protein
MSKLRSFFAEIPSLFSDLAVPFRAFVVAGVGVFLASLWFNSRFTLAIFLAFGIIGLGLVLYLVGKAQLPGKPVWGLRLMEFFVLAPSMLAAVAAGAVIVIAVNLAAPKEASDQTKELLSAVATAITAFLTSSFVDWTGDKDDSSVADRIKEVFHAKFKRFDPSQTSETGVKYFKAGSTGERWVYSNAFKGIEGWGGTARKKRAEGIALELQTGNSDPPAQPSNL